MSEAEIREIIADAVPAGGDPEWRKLLITKKGGDIPKPLLANAIVALRHAPEWHRVVQFDRFSQQTTLRYRTPWGSDVRAASSTAIPWTAEFDLRTAEWLQRQEIEVSANVAGEAVEIVASENTFHPVNDYLDRCRWDGEPRLDRWVVDYLGVENTKYACAVGARWMISAVARVSEPGVKVDCCLVLEGRQGLMKSTALRTLGGRWFADDIADLGSKDAAMQAAGVWILELAELDSATRGDIGRIKAFMSRAVDRFRPPYGKRVISIRRQCVFAGTVNVNDYLRDETGGRRFWPLRCGGIDIDGLAAARDQLWAEARDRYLAGETWWLDTADLEADAGEEQASRYSGDPWDQAISNYVAGHDSVTVSEILASPLGIKIEQWKQTDANRVGRCLRAIGWERYQLRDGKRREWRYRRPSSPVSPVDGD
jgi:predicted P-loop ATPase